MRDDFVEQSYYQAEPEIEPTTRGAPLLRFISCGSVDDGKSTLIGRLLFETNQLHEDQLIALERDSRKHGTQGESIDYALFLDGLSAEREQGITIDVAYRFFETKARKFIVADCPGHEQYTRNMATGASSADVAVVLVDARKGLLTQTRRHSFIVALLGVRYVILAVNKMDAIAFDQARFSAIESEYKKLANELGIARVDAVPISALLGENLTRRSEHMPWYRGSSLLHLLEQAPSKSSTQAARGFRLPVQWVARPSPDFRGFAGQIASGKIAVGDRISVNGLSRAEAKVSSIWRGDKATSAAHAGDSVLLRLDRELDVSRGDVLTGADETLTRSERFEAKLLWMHHEALREGQSFILKLASKSIGARVQQIHHRIDVQSQDASRTDALAMNELASCTLRLDLPMVIERYQDQRELGAFILIDKQSHATVAAGTITRTLAPLQLHPRTSLVTPKERANLKQQRPRCVWFTGLSGSGKSTLSAALDRQLTDAGQHVVVLDGDNLRQGLTRHLGFSASDRTENVRLVAETAKLMVDAGLIVLVSLISPLSSDRARARALFAPGEFVEVFVDTSLEVVQTRDPKGLYAKARAGEIQGFTGIDAPYERPESPELHLATEGTQSDALVERLFGYLQQQGLLN